MKGVYELAWHCRICGEDVTWRVDVSQWPYNLQPTPIFAHVQQHGMVTSGLVTTIDTYAVGQLEPGQKIFAGPDATLRRIE